MPCNSCSNKCTETKCHVNLYSDLYLLQIQTRICCLLQLLANLEAALQDDLRDSQTPSPPALPSANTQVAAQNLYNFFVDNAFYFASTDNEGLPPSSTSISALTTFGSYRYLECICQRVPFMWKNCSLTATYSLPGDDEPIPQPPVSVSLFDLALPFGQRYAYDQIVGQPTALNIEGVSITDYIAVVCCLKSQFNLIKVLSN